MSEELTAFLEARGLSAADHAPRGLSDVTHQELAAAQVIVCLEGDIGDYLDSVPFHTAVQHWKLDATPDMETLYRELASRTRDLIELLRGEGAD